MLLLLLLAMVGKNDKKADPVLTFGMQTQR
jgi:hypothetical protein